MNKNLDPIIGNWQITSVIYGDVHITRNCYNKTKINFKKNGTLNAHIFGLARGACTTNGEREGRWKNNNDGTYLIDSGDGIERTVNISFIDDRTFTQTIISENSNHKAIIHTYIKKD